MDTPERKLKDLAMFGINEKEHLKECLDKGFMTKEEHSKELKTLIELVKKGMEKIISERTSWHPHK